jgi:hypothetical protein
MKKIEIFAVTSHSSARPLETLQDCVNEFIKYKNVIDVQYQMAGTEHTMSYSAMVIYEE